MKRFGVLACLAVLLLPLMVARGALAQMDPLPSWNEGAVKESMSFQPMLELLAYLRANGFKTFIVSGGGIDFMRVFTEQVYGIPPEQVVGSVGETKLEMRNGKPVLVRLPKVNLVDDKAGKPVGIQRFIGRRRSATRTAISRCSSGPPPATAPASWGSFTIRTPSASGPTTASRRSAGSTSPWTRRPRRAGPWST